MGDARETKKIPDELHIDSSRCKELHKKLLGSGANEGDSHKERIDDLDIEEDEPIKLSRPSRARTWIIAAAKAIILIMAICGAYGLSSQLYSVLLPVVRGNDPLTICDCGHSIAEAKSMGCEYVPLAAAWLPPHCRDPELEDQFDRAGPGPNGEWTYYADKNGTKTYSRNELANLGGVGGNFVIYTTRAWHIVHCVYYWKKQIRLQETGAIMEPRFAGATHAEHCLDDFLDPIKPELIASGQQISLTSSGII